MKTNSLNNATATKAISPSETHAETSRDKVYIFPGSQATVSSSLHRRQRWEHAEHIEDFQMLAKLKALSTENKAQVKKLVAELYEEERQEREHRRLVREAFELTKRSLARYWGAEEDGEKPAEDI